ncbi:hypothetical protein PIB30_098371 [Stylosanthes scabra]|uniref:Uncharacterized protein n=1 Tax=Stylosanthes scabra TaxID=79078 RepID=A0ABU6YYD9_9FABA|nr:hypothetical protein [Stylosanthes scabra]
MPHVKRPTKKTRGASSSMEPPPQDHPLAQWQNLVNCMKIKDCFYPDLIAIAYTTLDVEFEENDMVESGNANEEFKMNYSKENACTMFNIPFGIQDDEEDQD